MMERLAIVILAAGEGKRMKSKLPKVLHPICGRPMIQYLFETTSKIGAKKRIIIVGYKSDQVTDFLKGLLSEGDEILLQPRQLGSGDGVRVAQKGLANFIGDILVLGADTPFLSVKTLLSLVACHRKERAAATLLVARLDDPTGYGRIIRGKDGQIERIVEEKDASSGELLVNEVNSGVYCFSAQSLFWGLPQLSDQNMQREFYLTDLVEMLTRHGDKVIGLEVSYPDEIMGINNRIDLARAEAFARKQILDRLMLEGVSIIDPTSTFIEEEVGIGRDTTIYPFSMILGRSLIGEDCTIGPQAYILDTQVGDRVKIAASFVKDSVIGTETQIGPFAHIRPETNLGEEIRIGNFVEVKGSFIHDRTKVNHLTYIGDSFIGEGVNIGAGTITCNYDGCKKHCTTIEDGAFIGSNTALVAPVRIGKNAVIGAGSTITEDVPEFSLAVARANQRIISEWTRKKKETY